jgi:hypothetical protein
MVVDYPSMSSVNFAIPEPCLIHLTMKVRTATYAGVRAAMLRRRQQVPEECGLPLEPVLDAPPAPVCTDKSASRQDFGWRQMRCPMRVFIDINYLWGAGESSGCFWVSGVPIQV